MTIISRDGEPLRFDVPSEGRADVLHLVDLEARFVGGTFLGSCSCEAFTLGITNPSSKRYDPKADCKHLKAVKKHFAQFVATSVHKKAQEGQSDLDHRVPPTRAQFDHGQGDGPL